LKPEKFQSKFNELVQTLAEMRAYLFEFTGNLRTSIADKLKSAFFIWQNLKIINQNQIYMKKILTLITIIIITCNIKAQDIMITKDGQKIEAKIEEIGFDIVKYKKFHNQTSII